MQTANTQNLAYILAKAHASMYSAMETSLRNAGLSVEQWRLLEILNTRQGLAMGTLAEQVLMKHSALTKMADKMVANGLIHRAVDHEDQRRILVFITDKGLALHNKLKTEITAHDEALISALGKRNSAGLEKLLNTVISHVNE